MKRFGVYFSDSWEGERIVEEVKRAGWEALAYDYREPNGWLVPEVGVFRTVVDRTMMDRSQPLDNRKLAREAAAAILRRGGYVFNLNAITQDPYDKDVQNALFKENGLPVPAEFEPGGIKIFPVIAKPKRGSLGMGVELLPNLQELKKFGSQHDFGEYVFQELLEVGRDYRIIVLGGNVLGVMERRAAKGKIVANYSLGGTVRKARLGKEALENAVEAATLMGLEYAGVDLIRDNRGGLRVLEVNRCAQFKGFEQATGVNVAKEIVEYCLEQARK